MEPGKDGGKDTRRGWFIFVWSRIFKFASETGGRKLCEYMPIQTIMTTSGTMHANSRMLKSGMSWSAIQAATACSRATIAKVAKRAA